MASQPVKKFKFESNILQTKFGTIKFTKGPNNSKKFIFINNKKTHEDAKDITLFENSIIFLIQCLEEVFNLCLQLPTDENSPDGELYSKTINAYGNEICIRTVLEANRYQGSIYILLRRYFFARESYDDDRDPTDDLFLPCRGAFRFSDKDDLVEFRKFVDRMLCMDKASQSA